MINGNRQEYRNLCGLVRQLAGSDGQAEVMAMITGLQQMYPRRSALREELEGAGQAIAKKARK